MNAVEGASQSLRDAGPLDLNRNNTPGTAPRLDLKFADNSLEWTNTLARLLRLGVSAANIEHNRRMSHRNGSTLSRELIANGLLDESSYYRALAAELGVPFVDVIEPNRLVILPGHALSALRKATVIKALAASGKTFLLSAPDDRQLNILISSLHKNPGLRETIRLTTPVKLDEALTARLTDENLSEAVFRLKNNAPELSASQVVTGTQGVLCGALMVLLPLFAWSYPSASLLICHALASLLFAGCVLMRVQAASQFPAKKLYNPTRSPGGPLPIYTVIVALYRETEVVPQLVSQLMSLNWPASRLEIMIVCEASDRSTIDLLRNVVEPSRIQIIVVPKLGPQTKPRALSFALKAARGEFVVIYDAEDRPHPDQLMEAYGRFQREPMSTACLQAPLVITNQSNGLLARMFGLEYAALFGGLLPFLSSSAGFFPLGGTSNHFRRSILDEAGGWDPYNVTEDADLGTRLCRLGFTCGTIESPTFEDAPLVFRSWRLQRIRWFKGWLQTWLVHMRKPAKLGREVGTRNFLRFQLLTIGMFLSALVYPSMLLVVFWNGYQILTGSVQTMSLSALALFVVDFFNIILGHKAFSILGSRVERSRGMKPEYLLALRLPLYWTLLSAAAWGALWELVRKPHHWNKTDHMPVEPAVAE